MLHRGAISLPLKSGLFTGNERHGALNRSSDPPPSPCEAKLSGAFLPPFYKRCRCAAAGSASQRDGKRETIFERTMWKKEDGWLLKAPMPRPRHDRAAISLSHISSDELLVVLRSFSPSPHHYRRVSLSLVLTRKAVFRQARSLRRQTSTRRRNASLPRSKEITGWGNETQHNSHAPPTPTMVITVESTLTLLQCFSENVAI